MGLVLTGGPIGSTKRDELLLIDLSDHGVDNEVQTFVKAWKGPDLLELKTRTPVQKPSEWMTPADWVTIAASVQSLVLESDTSSVVVLHGTDTVGFTTAALSFLLNDLPATVVVTGANLPMHYLESDGQTNIADAMAAARSLEHGVYLSFAGTPNGESHVHQGTTVRKMQAGGQCFESPNHETRATVSNSRVTNVSAPVVRNQVSSTLEMSSDVAYLTMVPGIDLDMMAEALISTGKRGVLLRLYTTATGPDNGQRDSIRSFVRRCNDNGIVVVTAIPAYSDQPEIFISGIAAQDEGAVFAGDMIPETAYVKLCWAIAQRNTRREVVSLFNLPIAGESQTLEQRAGARRD